MGEIVSRPVLGRSTPRGAERAAPDADVRRRRLERVVAASQEAQVRRRGCTAPGQVELRQPEAVQVRLVADDHVAEGRVVAHDRGRVARELLALGRASAGSCASRRCRPRRRPGRRAGPPRGRRSRAPSPRAGSARRARRPEARHPDGLETGETEQPHLELGVGRDRAAHPVLGGAEDDRRPSRVRRRREHECRRKCCQDPLHAVAKVAEVADIEEKLKSLPARPGVYLFRDERGEVLYIGKAKSLRPRVRSYFQEGRGDSRASIPQLVPRIADLEVIVTGSEVEALHLEQNLVKRHRPPFNVRLRDDKSFPYIAVTIEDDYPRVMFTRERHRRGVLYFGPYANAKKVRETLDVLNRVFQFRPVRGAEAGPPLRDPLPRLPHRALPRPLRRLHLEGRVPRGRRGRDQLPLRRHEDDRARAAAADAGGGRRRALRGRGPLPQPALRDREPGRAAGGRPA